MRCAVINCDNNNRNLAGKNWRFFHFPKDAQQLKKWLDFCGRKDKINTATACICNVHFKTEDFERNLQYELGFSRKNPTKLKAGSCPTIKATATQTQSVKKMKSTKKQAAKVETSTETSYVMDESQCDLPAQDEGNSSDCYTGASLKREIKQNFHENPRAFQATPTRKRRQEVELLDDHTISHQLADFADIITECNNKSINHVEPAKVKRKGTEASDAVLHVAATEAGAEYKLERLEIEIIDSLNANPSSDDIVHIVGSEHDAYVQHLEHEVSTLKNEVIHLQNERKQLLDENQSLRNNARLNSSRELAKNAPMDGKLAKPNIKSLSAPVVKRTVIFTANVDTIRKLRKIHSSTD